MSRAKRTDANQPAIVDALRKCGAVVDIVSMVPNLGYDLVVQYRGVVVKCEVKDGDKSPSRQQLTPSEIEAQRVSGDKYAVVASVDDALALLDSIREHAR